MRRNRSTHSITRSHREWHCDSHVRIPNRRAFALLRWGRGPVLLEARRRIRSRLPLTPASVSLGSAAAEMIGV
jgi:hypothetical protein